VSIRTRVRFRKIFGRIGRIFADAGVGARRWWAWTDRPPSLRAIWRLSRLSWPRVPRGNEVLGSLWWLANGTERVLMFLAVVAAPGFLQPLLRWVFARPTRRAGCWTVLVLLVGWLLLAHWTGARWSG
jgi:hypothetical protein